MSPAGESNTADAAALDASALAALTAPRRPARIACVGVYIVDVLGRPVAELPRGQRSLPLDEIRITPAGTAGGTSVDLARLGAEVVAVGAVGDDMLADFLLTALSNERVDTTHVVRKPDSGVQTSATILPIHPDGTRPAWHVPGTNRLLGPDDIPTAEIERCDALHYGGVSALPLLDGEPAAQMLRHAKEHGALTTADCLGVRREDAFELLQQCLPYVDLFMPNEGEALAITRADSVSAAARMLLDTGAGCVIVKRGEHGCLIVDEQGERAVPAFTGPVLDTTGCGDAFCAGVIVARSAGWTIEQAALFGSATGTLTARALGSDAGARSFDEALTYMRTAPRAATPEATGKAS
ncbi:MAG TPA: sugar kinase [Conexibacter sp.]|jgi:sugar/nucleoside kinase (ribokinase family)